MPRTTLLRKQVTPTGTIQPHAGATAPDGFLVCDGTIVNIADYPRLYAVIGTSWGYGNNDGLTFHLPDLRGRFLRGNTQGMDPAEAALRDPDYALRTPPNAGGNSGDGVGSVQGNATKRPNTAFGTSNPGNHAHTSSYSAPLQTSANNGGGLNLGRSAETTSAAGAHTHTITTGGDAETRPINANVNYVIKAV